MSRYVFNLKKKAVLDKIRSPMIYEFNLAKNLALLSNDSAVIRNFYQVEIQQYYQDVWVAMGTRDAFMAQYIPGQAFTYFGIIPMIVNAKVQLLASNGFVCKSKDPEIDKVLNEMKDKAKLQSKFERGVYWESGIGDVAFRLSYNPKVCKDPLIKVIEPQHLEVNYKNDEIKSFVIKECSNDDPSYEICEIHSLDKNGYACIDYKFRVNGKYVLDDDEAMIKSCREKFDYDIDTTPVRLPIKGWLVIYKQNTNNNQLYRGERGVPDIQGIDTIEDALTESISDLIDAIRKGGVKEYVSEELIPQDAEGNDLRLNHFNKTIITTRAQSTPGQSNQLWQVVQGDIRWEAYTKTIQNLMSVAINKVGLAPTTLGLTGLESINSSAESQDAREKTSLRTREICLESWKLTLKELLNKYLQVLDYINGEEIYDYSDLINIQFNDYTSPAVENVTNVLAQQVATGLKSHRTAIEELMDGDKEEAEKEFTRILEENMQNVLPAYDEQDLENSDSIKNANLENSNSANANLGVATEPNANLENSNS